ncbi:hypothetical protein [Geobacter sp. AOG2]|uniref:hypothetical protein n=1 Tax=Geobacter sp. AOG2 TaxID=1566347 RepID=UPI001CC80619|nr:hypothetical protein [Geobacter sp. AOG2]GFE59877.1 hypothetical protein AOG2_04650 [Geobacter sp. AOG2]
MFKKLCKSITPLMLLAAVPAMAEEAVPYNCDFSPSCEVAPGVYGGMSSPVTSKFKLSLGGYVKLDYVHNSNAVGPISPGAPAGGFPIAGSKDESLFSAKQSRIWMKVGGPTFLGAKTNALIEMDFWGGSSASNEMANVRMRHAYGSLDWANTQVLFGQFWDIFGAAAADTIDFRLGGTTGNPANPRVPQIRLTQKLNLGSGNTLKFVLGAQNPVQDNAVAGDNSLSKTGAFGSAVNGAGQISFSSKALGVSPGYMGLGNSPLTVTLFGLVGNEKFTDNNEITSYGYGAYVFVPVLKSSDGKSRAMTLSLETQAYVAAGMDVQGATAMAVSGSKPNLNAAQGYGLYGQLKFYPTQNLGLTAGYGRRETLNWDKIKSMSAATAALNYGGSISTTAGNIERSNEQIYGNVTYDLNAAVRVAAEFQHFRTQYVSQLGQDNAVRLAVFYFF